MYTWWVMIKFGGFCISIPSFIISCTGKNQGLLVILKYVMNSCRQQLLHFSIKHRKSWLLFIEYTNIGIFLCIYHFPPNPWWPVVCFMMLFASMMTDNMPCLSFYAWIVHWRKCLPILSILTQMSAIHSCLWLLPHCMCVCVVGWGIGSFSLFIYQ